MNNNLIDISAKVDSALQGFFADLELVARDSGSAFFVIGATARDMILTHGYGIAPRRLTEDIDIGVHVESWDTFNSLKVRLVAAGCFVETGAPQRLRHKGGIPVDLVPFGSIETPENTIAWPPDQAIQMNVIGFQDAMRHSCLVRFNDVPVLDVPFATLAGLAMLKIAAWPDRGAINHKDASDLAFIMQVYLDAGNHERVYDEHDDLLEGDFDYEVAGARLLGRDIASIAGRVTRKHLLNILDTETGEQQQYRLVEAMVAALPDAENSFERHLHQLESLRTGITENL